MGIAGSALAFTVETVNDFGDITVMAVDGNYDSNLPNGADNSTPREVISQHFYNSHPDDYDFLFIFTNFDFKMPTTEAVAFYQGVRNDITGIGIKQFDYTWFFGSEGRLQGTIDMGNLSNLAVDPLDPDFSFTLGTMSHELMHRWGAFIKVRNADGNVTYDLLGQGDAHWSFLLDTKGSLMYGNPWQDNSDGTFTSLTGRRYYCPLDLYLMGLIGKSDVPPILLIDNPDIDKTQVSQPHITIQGTPRVITIDDIIAAEGERFPDYTTSQKDFKVACLYLTRAGTFASNDLSKIRTIMNNWVVWHSGLTNGKSSVEFLNNSLESLPVNPGPGTSPYTPRPTPAEVADAVVWLMEQQESDGYWADLDHTEEKDTAAAIRTLNAFADARDSVAGGLAWISQRGLPDSTDYLARIAETLILADAESAENYFSEIDERQNSDGAWGPARGYLSSTTDTALVLRAMTTAGQFDNPQLPETLEYLKLRQNLDGGWGGSSQVSDIQTTANVLIAFQPLRVAYELSQAVQQGLFWLNSQQKEDGGFGEGFSTVYDTAAVLAVFKIYDSPSEYFAPAIQFLQSRQSANGSWHDSVYETAVAAEALNMWKDSIDADLAVSSADITFSPSTITSMPETVAINVPVQNKGLADADDFNVALYENTTDAGNLISQQSISLAGQSTATVQFIVSFNDTQDHRLFVVVDPDNAITETLETNNVALSILTNDLNMDPDLQVLTEAMFFSPTVVNQMPADVVLEAEVLNTGRTDVASAGVVLYQDIISDSTMVGQQQISVGAESATTVFFPFTILDGETHRYFLIVDPEGLVTERNEYNNTAIKLLTSNPTYDFGLRAQDIALSATTVEMGQPLTITAQIRNIGNRDGYHVPVRFFLASEGLEFDIATLTFDLPAGGQVQHELTWTADHSGENMQIWVVVDPFNAFSELSEANNAVSASLTVNPYPDPNLTLTHQDIVISPSPANEGQGAVITATIYNNGGGPAEDILVDFAWNDPGEAPTYLGSGQIGLLNPGQNATVEWTIGSLTTAGKKQISVIIDSGNVIKEIAEDDNSAFKELEILSLPDFIIHASSIGFSPSAPAEGDVVTITVTVQNAGGQAVANVPVVLLEGGLQIDAGSIPAVPGNSLATIAFTYATDGKAGVHPLQVTVDPDNTIVEQRTDNNTAVRTLGVQNGDLWASQRYISADSDGGQSSTTFFFRLDQAMDVNVVVVNARERIVRTYNGPELIQTTGTSITWDGRNDRGQLVADGEYQIQVRDLAGNVLLALPVSVDNNLSPLALAVGTEYLSKNNISCTIPDITQWQWFDDESGILFYIGTVDEDTPEFSPGIYAMAPDGQDIKRLVPWEWTWENGQPVLYGYGDAQYGKGFFLAPDSLNIGFVLRKYSEDQDEIQYQVWRMNRFGEDLTLIDSVYYRQNGENIFDRINALYWSADGSRLAYWVGHTQYNGVLEEIVLVRSDGTGKVALPMIQDQYVTDVQWAPDGNSLLYVTTSYAGDTPRTTLMVSDTNGASHQILQVNGDFKSAQWINQEKIAAAFHDATSERDVMAVLDAFDNLNHAEAVILENGDSIAGELKVDPDQEGVVFICRHAVDSPEGSTGWAEGNGYWSMRHCDPEGQCRSLHEARAFYNATSLSDLHWSRQGDRIAFIDWVNQETASCEYQPGLVVMDSASEQKSVITIQQSLDPCYVSEMPMSFHVWSQGNGFWMEQGVLHFGSSFETQVLPLENQTLDEDGNFVLRLSQTGAEVARIDYLTLHADGQAYVPAYCVDLTSGEDIQPRILRRDGNSAVVTGHTLEMVWSGLPAVQTFNLELNAQEIFDADDDDTAADDDTSSDGLPTAAMGPRSIAQDSLQWMYDDDWMFGREPVDYYYEGDQRYPLFAIDAYSGKTTYFPLEFSEYVSYSEQLSPLSRYLTYWQNVSEESICYGLGDRDLWTMKSLLNLTADLKIVRKSSYVELHGTATDLNFDRYLLEYAELDAPDDWSQIQPPRENMVVDDLLGQWVPPSPGVYTVRLTVTDKAGHEAVKQRRLSWGIHASLVNLYLDETYITPNGDGVTDLLQLNYTVVDPVHLEFYVYSQQDNRLVATLKRDYISPPEPDGKDTVTWDGRDQIGQVVPDGTYRIEVLDYEFYFVLDKTPPRASLELRDIEIDSNFVEINDEENEPTEITASLKGAALDDHFKRWVIESGQGDNPSSWQEFGKGIDTYGKILTNRIEPETISKMSAEAIGRAADHKFRIVAEDLAGNVSVAASEVMEEIFVIYQWADQSDPDKSMQDLFIKRKEDGSIGSPRFILPINFLNTDIHGIKTLLTIRKPISHTILQYRYGAQWSDGPQVAGPSPGLKTIEFQGELPNLEAVNAVRLKAVDEDAGVHYSNPVPTQQYFEIRCVGEAGNDLRVVVYPFEDLVYLMCKTVYKDKDGKEIETILGEYDVADGDTIPIGILGFPDSTATILDKGATATLFGIGVSGEQYLDVRKVGPCDCDSNDEEYPEIEAKSYLTIARPGGQCGLQPGPVTITTVQNWKDPDDLKQLTYFLFNGGGWRQLRSYDLSTGPMGGAEIDAFARNNEGNYLLVEGNYPVKAVLEDVDGRQFEIREEKIDDSYIPATVAVDRTPPVIEITSPQAGTLVCPDRTWISNDGKQHFGVDLYALVHDNLQNIFGDCDKRHGSVAIRLAYPELPEDTDWLRATLADTARFSSNSTQSSLIGIWDLSAIFADEVSLRLIVDDGSGNAQCYEQRVQIDRAHPLAAGTGTKLFSPNGDGVLDVIDGWYSIEEAVTMNVAVVTPDGATVKTLVAGQHHSGGTAEFTWDGTDDGLQPAEDGIYLLRVSATDGCGNIQQKDIKDIELDRTPPTVQITFPQAGGSVGVIVEVTGTVEDKNFSGYSLNLLDENTLEPLVTLNTASLRVVDGILGRWNNFGTNGARVIQVTAWDKVGNTAEASVRVELNDRQNLIVEYFASPQLFSPNGDGKLETTVFDFSLNSSLGSNFNVALELINSDDALVRTLSADDIAGGAHSLTWDGRGESGQVLPDGDYRAVLRATLADHPTVMHQEQVTLKLDSTAPVAQLAEPLDGAYVPADLVIRGTVSDVNLESYDFTLGGTAERTMDGGQVSRADATFAVLDDLDDGPYTLTVNAQDLAQIETRSTVAFIVDKTPPELTLEGAVQDEVFGGSKPVMNIRAGLNENNIAAWQIRYRAADAGSGDWTILAQGDTLPGDTIAHDWNLSPDGGIADGRYTVSFHALDKAGWEKEITIGVAVDNTLPNLEITAPAESAYVKSATTITGTASDDHMVKCSVAVAEGDCAQAYQWNPLAEIAASVENSVLAAWQVLPPDGVYCLRVSAEDVVGHADAVQVAVTVDTTPPAAPVISGEIVNLNEAHITWPANGEADLAGYDIYRDGQKRNTEPIVSTEYIDTQLAEGTYRYTVRALDHAGWESEPSNTVALEIDLTPPVTRIRVPADGAVVGDLVEIKGTAYSQEDFKEYRLYVGQGTEPASWQLIDTSAVATAYGPLGQWDTVTLSNGSQYSLKLESEDLAGNIGEHRIAVTIDNLPPDPPVLLSAAAQDSLSDSVDVIWQANSEADLAGYLLYRNGELANVSGNVIGDLSPYLMVTTAYVDAELPDGTYAYYLLAMDSAGNLSDPSNTLSVTIDTRTPRAEIVAPAPDYRFDESIMLRAVATDQDIASVQFQFKAAGADLWIDLNPALTASPFITYLDPAGAGLTFGRYDLRAVATDTGGHTDGEPPTVTVEYADITPPVAPVDLQGRVDGGSVTLTWSSNTETDLAGYNVYEVLDGELSLVNDALVPDASYVVGDGQEELADDNYVFQVFAVDTGGNESLGSNLVAATIYTPKIEQPYTPTDQATVRLYCNTMPGDHLELFSDSGSGDTAIGTDTADDQGVAYPYAALAQGDNSLSIIATDDLGNRSKRSDPVVVTYGVPPAAPTGLQGVASGYDVNLTWNPNTEDNLAGYSLFRDGAKLNADIEVTGGTAQASLNNSRAGYARDGSSSSYWYTYIYPSSEYEVWWQLTLPAPVPVNRISLLWYSSYYAADTYELQAWSGHAWIPLIKVTGNEKETNSFDLQPIYFTDRFRLVIPPGGAPADVNRVLLAEFKLWQFAPLTSESYLDQSLEDGEHAYYLEAINTLGMISAPSDEATVAVGDVTPPQAPAGLTATADGSAVQLSWSAPGDSDLGGYFIYRQDDLQWTLLNPSPVSATGYTDSNLPNGTYTYRVTAVDLVGNQSEPSGDASATVSVAPPDLPINVSAQSLPRGGTIMVCWDATTGAAGYRLYRAAASGGPFVLVAEIPPTGNCYTDTGLTDGSAYYYVVHSVDAAGNESADSLEAQAVPSDLTAPPAPVLFAPTVAGHPVVTTTPRTDIIGFAEPGSSVVLFKESDPLDIVSAAAAGRQASYPLDAVTGAYEYIYQWTLSSDSRYVALTFTDEDGNDGCSIHDLQTGLTETFDGYIENPVWSPDGTLLAYQIYEASGMRIKIYDTRTDTTSAIPGASDDYYYESSPSWSADGQRLVYIGNQFNDTYQVCAYDLASQQIEQWVSVPDDSYGPMLSPDNRYVGFMVFASPYHALYLYDRETGGDPVLLSQSLYSSPEVYYGEACAAWTADGNMLGFVTDLGGSKDVYVWRAADQSIVPMTSLGDVVSFAWTPASGYPAYLRLNESSASIWISDTDGNQTELISGMPADMEFPEIGATASGEVGYFYDEAMFLIQPPGIFTFNDVSLSPGENIFSARATDAAGNQSPDSDAIVVNVDGEQLADIEIKSQDLFIYPYVPVSGDTVRFSAIVHNRGTLDAEDVTVDCYIWDADDNTQQIHATTISRLGAGQDAIVQFEWDSTGLSGKTTLIVEADAVDEIFETSEMNNMAFTNFYVAAGEGLQMYTRTDYDLYLADQDVQIDIEFYNSDRERNVTLTVEIVDAGQQAVATVAEKSFLLPYTPILANEFTWNTGRTLAGEYYVRSTLTDASGPLAENLVPITIDAALDISASLVTDRLHYTAGQNVQIQGSVANNSVNRIVGDLTTHIVVRDAAEEVLHEAYGSIGYLFEGTPASANTTWSTLNHPPGTYTVQLSVLDATLVVAQAERTFHIDETLNLSGTLSVAPAIATAGTPVTVSYTVTHNGNTPATGVPLSIIIVDPDTLTEIDGDTTAVDFDIAETISDVSVFDTQSYGAKTYRIYLRAQRPTGATILADGALTIQSTAQLPIQISGTLLADPPIVANGQSLTMRYTVTNEGTTPLEDIALELVLPGEIGGEFQHTVTLPIGTTLTGEFLVPTHALIPGTYSSALTVNLAVPVELAGETFVIIAPASLVHNPVALAGGPYIAAVGETIAVDGSDSFDPDEGLSESETLPYDTIIEWAWETTPVDPYEHCDFDDATGAVTELPAFDTPGLHIVVLRVTDNTEAAFPSEGWPNLTHFGEAEVTVEAHDMEDLTARCKATKCQLVWTHIGAAEYEILRSETGPNSGFEVIATTTSTYSTYLDTPIEMYKDYWYRVRCTVDGESRISTAVHVYSQGRI